VSLVFFVSFLGDAKKKENINVIETSSDLKTSNYFSIQFSIENHLPSKERRQARSDSLEASSFLIFRKRPTFYGG
jgi:anionic cell wall polymer biosynthesis LytR-Cps2A-Psr (LCP) family protein